MGVEKVFVNGRFYALDKVGSVFEAIAVDGSRIAALGSISEVRSAAGPKAVEVDLGGKTVIPGCIDTHCHLMTHGISCTQMADLSDSGSISEIQNRLRTHLQKNPNLRWVNGERFDQELFAEGRWITRQDLDKVSTELPVFVVRLCRHALVANTAALLPVRDKLTKEQWETGRLTEDATDFIWSQTPDYTDTELEKALLYGLNDAKTTGLTTVHCQLNNAQHLEVLRKLRSEGRLPVRVRLQWPVERMEEIVNEGLKTGSGDDHLRIGSIKIFMDGSLGARTAAMCEEYSDDPGNLGDLFRDAKDLAEMLVSIQRSDCQAAIHAIGDRAIVHTLRAIEIAMPENNENNRLRHRIEHIAQLSPQIIADVARLNVIASIQPQFVITDFWSEKRVGPKRYKYMYPFRTMLDAGIKIGIGSDCPVERLDTIETIHRAVNREPSSLSECLTVDETLRGYTCGSAYAGFEENDKGSLEVGKLADFVALSDDPYGVEPEALEQIKVIHTIVGGEM